MKKNRTGNKPEKKAGQDENRLKSALLKEAQESISRVHMDLTSVAEEQKLLIKREDGQLEIEDDIKARIIQALKQDDAPDPSPPRILMKGDENDEKSDEIKETEALAVKAIEEERKIKREESESSTTTDTESWIEKIENEKPNLSHAEVFIVKESEYGIGLSYSPGTVPIVVSVVKGKNVAKFINESFELGVPVLEVPTWPADVNETLEIGAEIPESLYSPSAQALATVYRLQPGADMVRYIKPVSRKTPGKLREARKRLKELDDHLKYTTLTLNVGEELFSHKDEVQKQMDMVINHMAWEFGIIIPRIVIRKKESLCDGQFLILFKELITGYGTVDMSVEPPEAFHPLQTKVRFTIYRFLHELLGYPEVSALLERTEKQNRKLVRNLFQGQFTLGGLRAVLKCLLREKVPIRDMNAILETIVDNQAVISDPEVMTEYVRSALSYYLSHAFLDPAGTLNVLILAPEVETLFMQSIKEGVYARWLDMDYNRGINFLSSLGKELKGLQEMEIPIVILTTPAIRRFVRKTTEAGFPDIPVLSYSEIAPLTPVKTVGIVK